MKKKNSFTLIELVMVVVILSIISVVALPRFFDLRREAREAAEQSVVASVRSGIAVYYANQCATGTCAWPAHLSSAAGSGNCLDNPCFDNVLQAGGLNEGGWEKYNEYDYLGPVNERGWRLFRSRYRYNPGDGSFSLVAVLIIY